MMFQKHYRLWLGDSTIKACIIQEYIIINDPHRVQHSLQSRHIRLFTCFFCQLVSVHFIHSIQQPNNTRYRTLIQYNWVFNLRIYWMQHKNIVQCIRCLLISKYSYLYTQKHNLNIKKNISKCILNAVNTVYRHFYMHIHHNKVDKIVIQCNVPLKLISYQSSKEEETKH